MLIDLLSALKFNDFYLTKSFLPDLELGRVHKEHKVEILNVFLLRIFLKSGITLIQILKKLCELRELCEKTYL